MTVPVYSTRLILEAGLTAPVDALTCPAGFVTVITSVNWVTGLNATQAYAYLVHATTGAKFAAVQTDPAGSTDYFNQMIEGRWVLAAGEVVQAWTDGASAWDVFASGYLLTLP